MDNGTAQAAMFRYPYNYRLKINLTFFI